MLSGINVTSKVGDQAPKGIGARAPLYFQLFNFQGDQSRTDSTVDLVFCPVKQYTGL